MSFDEEITVYVDFEHNAWVKWNCKHEPCAKSEMTEEGDNSEERKLCDRGKIRKKRSAITLSPPTKVAMLLGRTSHGITFTGLHVFRDVIDRVLGHAFKSMDPEYVVNEILVVMGLIKCEYCDSQKCEVCSSGKCEFCSSGKFDDRYDQVKCDKGYHGINGNRDIHGGNNGYQSGHDQHGNGCEKQRGYEVCEVCGCEVCEVCSEGACHPANMCLLLAYAVKQSYFPTFGAVVVSSFLRAKYAYRLPSF